MIQFIKNWFLMTFFQTQLLARFAEGVDAGKNTGYNQAIDQRNKDRKEAEAFELQKFIGQKVIVIGNHWEDPIFGYGKFVDTITQDKSPVLVLKDSITDEVLMTLGKTFLYSDSLMNTILMLNPYQRWELATGQSMARTADDRLSDITPPEAMVKKLKEVGYLGDDFVFEQSAKHNNVYLKAIAIGEKEGRSVGHKEGYEEGYDEAVGKSKHFNIMNRIYCIQPFLQKKVIAITDNWSEMFFGTCIDIDVETDSNNPYPIIEDALTKEKKIIKNTLVLYSDSAMNAILKLDRRQRFDLFNQGKTVFPGDIDVEKSVDDISVDDLISKLKDVGYLDQNFVFEQKSKELSIFNEGVREGEKNMEIKLKPKPRTKAKAAQ